jgi:hypothetical protein
VGVASARPSVFYEVNEGPPAVVQILAVGIKARESLRIGEEEIEL